MGNDFLPRLASRTDSITYTSLWGHCVGPYNLVHNQPQGLYTIIPNFVELEVPGLSVPQDLPSFILRDVNGRLNMVSRNWEQGLALVPGEDSVTQFHPGLENSNMVLVPHSHSMLYHCQGCVRDPEVAFHLKLCEPPAFYKVPNVTPRRVASFVEMKGPPSNVRVDQGKWMKGPPNTILDKNSYLGVGIGLCFILAVVPRHP